MSIREKRYRQGRHIEGQYWWDSEMAEGVMEQFAIHYAVSDNGLTWTDGVRRPVLRIWELLWAGIAQLEKVTREVTRKTSMELGHKQYRKVSELATTQGVSHVLNRIPSLVTHPGAWLYHVCRNDWAALEQEIADNNMIIFDGVLANQLMDLYNPVVPKGAGSPRKSRQAGPPVPAPLIVPRMAPYPTEGHAGGIIPAPDPLPIRWHVMKVKETDPIRLCAAQSPWD